jgi:hypothetical protein
MEISLISDWANEVTDALLTHKSREEGIAKEVKEKIKTVKIENNTSN